MYWIEKLNVTYVFFCSLKNNPSFLLGNSESGELVSIAIANQLLILKLQKSFYVFKCFTTFFNVLRLFQSFATKILITQLCLPFNIKGIVWRKSRQVRSLGPWIRPLTGCLYLRVVRQAVIGGSDGVAQLEERRASNRKVVKPWFDSGRGSASLCPWERHLMLFSTLELSSLPVVVTQPDCKQNSFCVGVVWQTQSIVQHLVQTKKTKIGDWLLSMFSYIIIFESRMESLISFY